MIRPAALEAGVRASEFWDLTYGDIMETIEVYQEKEKAKATAERDLRALLDYTLANLIAVGFNDPKKFPEHPSKAYPFLQVPQRAGTWQESKAEMAAIAAAHNRRIRKEGTAV